MGKQFLKFLFLALFITACGRIHPPGQKNQGVITYKVTYLKSDLKNMSTSLLPKVMVQKFRHHMSINTIEGFFGRFTLSNVSDGKKHTNTTLLKILGKGYMYSGPSGEYGCCFDPFVGMVISFSDQTKMVAGYQCKLALATFPGIRPDTFNVWYTQELGIENPNVNNPFSAIDGVLLEFNLHLKNLELRLEAEKVEHTSVPWSEFEVPDGYKECSKQKMEDILNALLE